MLLIVLFVITFVCFVFGASCERVESMATLLMISCVGLICLLFTIAFGSDAYFNNHEISNQLISQVYALPSNSGDVYVYTGQDGAQHAIESASDNDLKVEFSKQNRIVKSCNSTSHWIVPWTVNHCRYILYTDKVVSK